MKPYVVEYTDRDGRTFHVALEAASFEDAERRLVMAVQTGEVLECVITTQGARGLKSVDWFLSGVFVAVLGQFLWGLV